MSGKLIIIVLLPFCPSRKGNTFISWKASTQHAHTCMCEMRLMSDVTFLMHSTFFYAIAWLRFATGKPAWTAGLTVCMREREAKPAKVSENDCCGALSPWKAPLVAISHSFLRALAFFPVMIRNLLPLLIFFFKTAASLKCRFVCTPKSLSILHKQGGHEEHKSR